jgi:hypothetical protein
MWGACGIGCRPKFIVAAKYDSGNHEKEKLFGSLRSDLRTGSLAAGLWHNLE